MTITLLGLAAVLAGLVSLGVRRGLVAAPSRDARAWEKHRLAWWDWSVGAALVAAMNHPLVRLLPALFRDPAPLAGDGHTHAAVVAALAGPGPHGGWVDAFMGGFPLGVHYPTLGWLCAAAFVKLGLGAAAATQLVGVASLLVGPWLAFVLARRAGAGFSPALAAAAALSCVAPYFAFVGGHESALAMGLFAQVVSVPYAVALAYALATEGPRWRAPALAALCALAHPQVALALVACAAPAVAAAGSRAARERYLRAALATAAVCAAVYGPGLLTLGVPFGWPRFREWSIVGPPPERLPFWIEGGELLDDRRAPVLTASWIFSFGLCVALARKPAPRAAAVLTVAALAGTVAGHLFKSMGRPGALLLSFLQPLRVMSVLPLCLAVVLAIAGREAGLWARAIADAGLGARRGRALVGAAGALAVALAVCAMLEGRTPDYLGSFARSSQARCAALGGDAGVLRSWVGGLRGGRLWFDVRGPLLDCAVATDFEARSAVPIAITVAVGAHVGAHFVAARALDPDAPSAARRAEALGVRYLLHEARSAPASDGAPRWRLLHRRNGLAISERVGGTDVVGVGCRTERWSAADPALREALYADLERGARTLSPDDWVELRTEPARGVLSVEPVTAGERAGCDATHARVEEGAARTPGRVSAVVTSGAPVDVVLRVASYPWWHVFVDGRETPSFVLAPGYLGVRVFAGRHEVRAESQMPWKYPFGIALSAVLVALLGAPVALRLPRRRPASGALPPSP